MNIPKNRPLPLDQPVTSVVRVREGFLAGLCRLTTSGSPIEVPLVTVLEGGECGHGFGVGCVPAPAAPFEPRRAGLASRFCRATADLPAFGQKLRVVDHVPTLGDV